MLLLLPSQPFGKLDQATHDRAPNNTPAAPMED
jgi:hypothetical protein